MKKKFDLIEKSLINDKVTEQSLINQHIPKINYYYSLAMKSGILKYKIIYEQLYKIKINLIINKIHYE